MLLQKLLATLIEKKPPQKTRQFVLVKKKKNRHKLLLYLKITSHILNADRLNDMILNDNLFWQDLFIVI